MLKKILLGVGALVLVLLAVVANRPDTYHVERSTTINAPAEAVFAVVGDLKNWPSWSPWEKRDPGMRKTFSTDTTAPGATLEWQGNKDVGKGKMTIVGSNPPSLIQLQLEFLEPFASTARATYEMKPAGAGVNFTWSMDGENNFVGKAFSMFMDMDKMIGGDFEQGLANLKRVVESTPAHAR